MKRNVVFAVCVTALCTVAFGGCASNQELVKSNNRQRAVIESLTNEVNRLNGELNRLSSEQQGLLATKSDLESKLQQQMRDGDLSIAMQDRGLVVTINNRILFDSGKAELKVSARDTLSKIASSLTTIKRGQMVYIEGHTDNDPIRFSSFASNWELSTARATEVIHHLVDTEQLDPQAFVACGYGEFHPVADNDSQEGKARNRRVEIIISPEPSVNSYND